MRATSNKPKEGRVQERERRDRKEGDNRAKRTARN